MSEAAVVAVPAAAPAPVVSADNANDASGVDIVSDARQKARELLFSDKEPEKEAPEEPKVEAKPEAAPEPEKPKPEERSQDEIALSKEWGKIRRDRKAFDADSKKLKAEMEAFKSREAALAAKEAKLNDPVAFLNENGWSKDRIIEFIQSDGKVDPEILIKQLGEKHQRELAELRAEREREREGLESEKQQRQLASLKSELDAEVSALAKEPDFKLLQRFIAKKGEAGVQKRVADIIAEVWNKKKEVLDPRDVLVYLEQELAEIQLGDAPGQPPAVKSANAAAVEPRPITNKATSERTVIPSDYDEEDPEARRERAAKILRGEIEE